MKKRKKRSSPRFVFSKTFYYLGGGALLLILISIFTNKAKPAYLTRQDFLSSGQNVLGEEEKKDEEENDYKIKYELQNGQVVTKTEDGKGEEVELENEEMEDLEDEVENELEDDGIKIATEGSGRLTFEDSRISAPTNFPLSIDVGTKQLVVNTPAGQKIVTVLPDEAVNNLLMSGIISKLNNRIKTKANLEFKIRNNEPVYEIDGLKTYRLFALITVSRPLLVVVSTETGEVVSTEKSFLTDAVDFLSP